MKQISFASCTFFLCVLLSGRMAYAQCSGTANTAVTGGNDVSVGTLSWSNTNNIALLDGSLAKAGVTLGLGSVTTNYLTATNLGITVPPTYTVCGVTAAVYKGTSVVLTLGNSIQDNMVKLVKGGVVTGTNEAASGAWPSAITEQDYGSSTDTWGPPLLPADINASFGVAVSAKLTSLIALTFAANVDMIGITVYSSPPAVLPVAIQNYTVTGGPGGDRLSWTTVADNLANEFVVQRSGDDVHWSDLTSISANGDRDSYQYTDADPLSGANYYRLELRNGDATVGYSVVAAVATKVTPGIHFYPNPFNDMISITAPTTFTRVMLTDMTGRTLWAKEYSGGVYSARIPAGTLPRGLYFVSVDGAPYKLVKN